MSLEEDLARRLKDVTRLPVDDYAQAREVYTRHYEILAREVIRQMEWSRRAQLKYLGVEPVRCKTEGCDCEIGIVPLTLAPEDWKP